MVKVFRVVVEEMAKEEVVVEKVGVEEVVVD